MEGCTMYNYLRNANIFEKAKKMLAAALGGKTTECYVSTGIPYEESRRSMVTVKPASSMR